MNLNALGFRLLCYQERFTSFPLGQWLQWLGTYIKSIRRRAGKFHLCLLQILTGRVNVKIRPFSSVSDLRCLEWEHLVHILPIWGIWNLIII